MPLDAGPRKPLVGANGQPTNPDADDFLTNEDFEKIPEGLRDKVRIRLASLSRENRRTTEMLERLTSQQHPPQQNGNGHGAAANGKPDKPAADPQDPTTWNDPDLSQLITDFDAYEARFFANGEDEEAKRVVMNQSVRRRVNAARIEQGRRAALKSVDERLAPFEAEKAGERLAGEVFGNVMKYLAPKFGGAQNASRLLMETKEDVDERLAMVGKDRSTATPHEIGMAMAAAVEAKAMTENRDGDAGVYRRGRPEIAGEGFGGRSRAGGPDDDAEVSARLKDGRVPEANRLMIQQFLTNPGYAPPREFVPQHKADY